MLHVLDWLSLLRMRCAASVSGFGDPSICFDSCCIVASSLGVQAYLFKYDWTLIPRVICCSVAGLPDYKFLRWLSVPIFRGFSYDVFWHRSFLSSWTIFGSCLLFVCSGHGDCHHLVSSNYYLTCVSAC